jgi:C1A family cysteine protease
MKFGYIPDLPDFRDWTFKPTVKPLRKVDLRPLDTPIYNQGNLGSCTANAIAGHLDFNRKREGLKIIKPSRLFIYYNERNHDGTVQSDAGSSIRESVKTVNKQGAVPEIQWPYTVDDFTLKPPEKLYKEAVSYEDLTYYRLNQNLEDFKACLSEGYPFVGGITVYSSFPMQGSSTVPIPRESDSVKGGHAIMFVGYNDDTEFFIFRNSWGDSWGSSGYGYIPYSYLANKNLANDFWSLRKVK